MRRIMLACALFYAACQGERGPAGEDGEDGTDGTDGQSGPQGPMGEQGLMGLQGPIGATGPEGPKGATGAKGTDGARGPSGAPAATSNSASGGSSYRPAGYVSCVAQLDLLNGATLGEDGVAETIVSYTIMRYSNDDIEVTCYALLGTSESPQYSAYYPAITQGSVSATCEVASDYPPYPGNGGIPGFWTLELMNGMPTAAYTDADTNHPLDGEGFVFAENSCASFVMDLGGMWYSSTLAEAL
jgi:hypothetical protein